MTYDVQYFTKNRKLKLEEYDDEGNLIDTIEFDNNELGNFLISKISSYNGFSVSRYAERNHFKGQKLQLFKQILWATGYRGDIITPENIKTAEDIFENNTLSQIKFALGLKNYIYDELNLNFTMSDSSKIKNLNFYQILEWTNISPGIWYAIDDKGNKGMTYLEEPTKKQAKYQRAKNGKRIVFLSFKNWKEYLVLEDELK
ncbi:Uncharacterised protein [[Clostridium] sordellii]|uniref:hypothetical protein n=1 Tax=Paraclostridium sordellii TaxID=1505 RepID=UPI0005E18FBB|nr:hypothetical protein [Paeniclostridium sordellii]CEN75427.1 Uncharacterised protein [[Clostridium] sordellii] [Paeniclostridium sordellii]